MADVHNQMSGSVAGPFTQVGHADQVLIGTQDLEVLAGLPRDTPNFTGRDHPLALLTAALAPDASSGPVVVSGLPGVGKTALAVRAGHQVVQRGWFPGGVLFADLRGYSAPVDPISTLSTFVRALGVPHDRVPADRVGLEQTYRSLLAAKDDSVLVLLDDVSSAEQVIPFLPGTGVHRTLVTSRHRLGALAGATQVSLDVFEADEAVEFLISELGADRVRRELDAVRMIAELCGYLPLALYIVTALLSDDVRESFSDFAEVLRDETNRLEELRYGDDLAVRAAFYLSYARLDLNERRLFRILSFHAGPRVSLGIAAGLAKLELPKVRRLLRSLCRAHMLQLSKSPDWFQFHDLIRIYANERSLAEDPQRERDEAIGRMLDRYVKIMTAILRANNPFEQSGVDRTGADGADQKLIINWLEAERVGVAEALALAHRTGHYAKAAEIRGLYSWMVQVASGELRPTVKWPGSPPTTDSPLVRFVRDAGAAGAGDL